MGVETAHPKEGGDDYSQCGSNSVSLFIKSLESGYDLAIALHAEKW